MVFHNHTLSKKICGPFLWVGFNCLKATEPIRGDSLVFTIKFTKIPGTYLINFRRMKGWVNPEATQWFWTDPSNLSSCINKKIQIKITIYRTDSIVTLNCELCQSKFSVSSSRLIIKLAKIYFLCTHVDQMIIQQRFNVFLQLQFYSIFTDVLFIIFKSFHWNFKDLPTT